MASRIELFSNSIIIYSLTIDQRKCNGSSSCGHQPVFLKGFLSNSSGLFPPLSPLGGFGGGLFSPGGLQRELANLTTQSGLFGELKSE
jgi:hypothetical protein